VNDAGLSTRAADTLLTERAADCLAGGPITSRELVARVCQLPAVPDAVAEHMAATLLGGYPRFVREADGLWRLAVAPAPAPPANADALESLSFVVVDVETTGTSPDSGHRITEFAAVVVRDGEVAEHFETLVNPQRPIPRYITQLTNISWEMVKDAPTFGQVCDRALGVMAGHVFVAHNAAFDWRFVTAEVRRATGRELDGRRLCTVRLARKLLPQLRRRSLDWVANHYGVEIGARHRAMGDALATARVLLRLLHDARERGCATWSDLDALCGQSAAQRRRRRPPAMPHPVRLDTTA
jgi:DNA polymerase III subunit epsilon